MASTRKREASEEKLDRGNHAFLLQPSNELSIGLYAGLTIIGLVDETYRIDYLDAVEPRKFWEYVQIWSLLEK